MPARSRARLLAAIAAFAAFAAFACVSTPATRADESVVRLVNTKKSSATFSVAHLYVTNVTGSVPIASGSVTLVPGSAIPTRVDATLDPTHIGTGEDERDAELQDADWFDTKQFPTWTYTSSKIVPAADGKSFSVEGTLTVHGVAQPVALAVTVVQGLPAPVYHAVGHADRHAFGMHVTRQDALIGTDLVLTLDVSLRAAAQ